MIEKYKPEIQAQILKTPDAFPALFEYGDAARVFFLLKKWNPADQYEILLAKSSTRSEDETNIEILRRCLPFDEEKELGRLFKRLQRRFKSPDYSPMPRIA